MIINISAILTRTGTSSSSSDVVVQDNALFVHVGEASRDLAHIGGNESHSVDHGLGRVDGTRTSSEIVQTC